MILFGLLLWFSEEVFIVDLSNSGMIRARGVRAYWDADLKEEAKDIPWGTNYIGVPRNITLYLYSVSNAPVKLEISTGNWTFFDSAGDVILGPADSSSFMNVSWDYSGKTILPRENLTVTFTLLIFPEADIDLIVSKDINRFSFDISVVAIEQ